MKFHYYLNCREGKCDLLINMQFFYDMKFIIGGRHMKIELEGYLFD